MGFATRFIGWDIGGANIKAVALKAKNGSLKIDKCVLLYCPIWKVGLRRFHIAVRRIAKSLAGHDAGPVAIGATMTAELSDVFETKREGVATILRMLQSIAPTVPILTVTVDAELISPREALEDHLAVSGANWAATGWLVGRFIPECILMDVGSTTTDIIPVKDGRPSTVGKTDLERLRSGELVYTGCLRTPAAQIARSVPVNGSMVNVSAEFFGTSADIHLVLGHIKPKDYTVETADGRAKTRSAALRRLARVVCADHTMLSASQILEIARHLYEQQVMSIAESLSRVKERLLADPSLPIVLAGSGAKFLGRQAAKQAGCRRIFWLSSLIGRDASIIAPAVAAAAMVAYKKRAVPHKFHFSKGRSLLGSVLE